MLDILVIGGGPAGLNAGLYAKRSGLSVSVVEKMPHGVGQIALSSEVDNYLGIPGLGGYDLGELFKKHIKEQGVEIREGEVVKIEKDGKFWRVIIKQDLIDAKECGQGKEDLINEDLVNVIKARSVIYAAGAVYRPLSVKASKEDLRKSVSYCAVCDGAFYKGKDVAVIGGGDTALDDALYLSQICRKVYLVHRRREFRGSRDTLVKIEEKENVEILTPFVLKGLKREGDESVLLFKSVQEEEGAPKNGGQENENPEDVQREIHVSRVFVAIGMTPRTGLVSSFIELNNQGYIIADESGKTNVEGFFAAGDVRTKTLRQIITAVSDGANAAVSAQEYLK